MSRAKVIPDILEHDEEIEVPTAADRKAAELAADMSELGLVPENPLDNYQPPAELMARNDAFISVHRIDPNSKERIYCCQYAPSEFTLERLRLDKGGGYYWVKLLAPNPNNRGRPSVFWSAYPKLEGPPRTENQPLPAGAPVVQSDNTAVLVTMQQGFAEMARVIGDALRTAHPAVPVQTRREMLEELKILRDMFAPERQEPQGPLGGLGMVRELLTLAKELQPSDPDASPATILMNAADKLLPMLGGILAQSVPAAGHAVSQPVAPAPAIAAPQEDDMSIRLKMGISYLVGQAISDAPPETSAYMVLDNIPENDVRSFVIRPDWLEFLAGYDPRVMQYGQWFMNLREEISNILREEPAPDENLTTEKQGSTTGAIATGVAGNR